MRILTKTWTSSLPLVGIFNWWELEQENPDKTCYHSQIISWWVGAWRIDLRHIWADWIPKIQLHPLILQVCESHFHSLPPFVLISPWIFIKLNPTSAHCLRAIWSPVKSQFKGWADLSMSRSFATSNALWLRQLGDKGRSFFLDKYRGTKTDFAWWLSICLTPPPTKFEDRFVNVIQDTSLWTSSPRWLLPAGWVLPKVQACCGWFCPPKVYSSMVLTTSGKNS